MVVSNAASRVSRGSEGTIPAFEVAITHHRSILWHTGKSEVKINTRAVDMRAMCGGVHTIRYRLQRGNNIVINGFNLAPGARHFNGVGDQTQSEQVPSTGTVLDDSSNPLRRRIGRTQAQICHDHQRLDLSVHSRRRASWTRRIKQCSF